VQIEKLIKDITKRRERKVSGKREISRGLFLLFPQEQVYEHSAKARGSHKSQCYTGNRLASNRKSQAKPSVLDDRVLKR